MELSSSINSGENNICNSSKLINKKNLSLPFFIKNVGQTEDQMAVNFSDQRIYRPII